MGSCCSKCAPKVKPQDEEEKTKPSREEDKEKTNSRLHIEERNDDYMSESMLKRIRQKEEEEETKKKIKGILEKEGVNCQETRKIDCLS